MARRVIYQALFTKHSLFPSSLPSPLILGGRGSCCCSVSQSYPTLCNSVDCSTPGFPVPHHLPEFGQTHAHWVDDAIQLSHPLSSPSPPAFNLSQLQCLFQSVGSSYQVTSQRTGASASASVLPMNIQGWFPLGLTGLISLQSKGLSRVFSSTTFQCFKFYHFLNFLFKLYI